MSPVLWHLFKLKLINMRGNFVVLFFFFVRLKSAFITFIFNCLPCSVGQRARVSYFKCMSLAHDYTEYDRVLFLLQIALLK